MALVDWSGNITLGTSAQTLMPANATRNGFSVQNTSSADIWINEVGATAVAASPSIKIAAGTTYTTPYKQPCPYAVSIYGGTTSQTFTAREW